MSVRPRLLVTRPTERQEPFGARARALGVEPVPFPCMEIVPDASAALPDAGMLRAEDLVLFTSRPAVEAFVARRPLPWPGTRLAAIGSATAEGAGARRTGARAGARSTVHERGAARRTRARAARSGG